MGYKGRHRKPTNAGRNVARAATLGIVAMTPLSLVGVASADTSPPLDQLAELLRCESGGNPAEGLINWTAENPAPGATASGAFQIIDSTWRAYGGREFAATASGATPEQQTIVAARIAQQAGVDQWSCAGRAGFVDPDVITWSNVRVLLGDTEPVRAEVEVTSEVEPVEVVPEEVAPEVAPTPAPQVAGRHRIVDPGDTLSGISLEFGVADWRPLYNTNRSVVGANPNLIFPGQRLAVPDSDAATPPVASTPAPPVVEEDVNPASAAGDLRVEVAEESVSDREVSDLAAEVKGYAALNLPGVQSGVLAAGALIAGRFDVGTVLGVGPRPRKSDHTTGLALDFMVNRATGDQIADFVLANMSELNVKYVIWRQRINYGSGWETMTDRGSATANHFDHVHVSFRE